MTQRVDSVALGKEDLKFCEASICKLRFQVNDECDAMRCNAMMYLSHDLDQRWLGASKERRRIGLNGAVLKWRF